MIIRGRRPDHPFTILPNEAIRNQNLSWKARGILAYVLSMPDDWRTSSTHLAQMAPDGLHAVRGALNELERAGYLQRARFQGTDGRWSTTVTVFDVPICGTDRPAPPMSGFPTSDNRASY